MDQRKIVVLYGSQTGTAQDVAEQIGREGQRKHLLVKVQSLDDYNIAQLVEERFVIFVVATTGQGDPPDNMNKFWRFILRRSLPQDSLQSLTFALLGLGDSSYLKFNYIAKKLFKRLQQLGAHELMPIALADDQHELGAEAVIDPWLRACMESIMTVYPLPADLQPISQDVLLPSKFKITLYDGASASAIEHNSSLTSVYDEDNPFYAKMLSNAKVTADDHWQDVRLICLDLSSSGIQYGAGDVMMIAPENPAEDIEQFMQLMNLNPDDVISLTASDKLTKVAKQVTVPCTWRYICARYLDICGTPKRYFWEIMAHYSSSDLEREKFIEFTTADGQQDLFDYVHRPRRTIVEILADFPQVAAAIPHEYIFDLIPVLQPRAFSLASSQALHSGEAQLLMAVVRYKSKRLVKPRRGVCSTWLAGIDTSKESRIPVWIKKGTIQFPRDADRPVIMVGPGTGVAPFRNYIQERVASGARNNVLFFGCRNKDKDFYCAREWEDYCGRGLLQLFTAFSRDQDDKVYVQDLIRQQSALVWNLVYNQNACFFLAGNAKNMPDAVREALRDVIVREGGMTTEAAQTYISDMDKSRRFQAETWS